LKDDPEVAVLPLATASPLIGLARPERGTTLRSVPEAVLRLRECQRRLYIGSGLEVHLAGDRSVSGTLE